MQCPRDNRTLVSTWQGRRKYTGDEAFLHRDLCTYVLIEPPGPTSSTTFCAPRQGWLNQRPVQSVCKSHWRHLPKTDGANLCIDSAAASDPSSLFPQVRISRKIRPCMENAVMRFQGKQSAYQVVHHASVYLLSRFGIVIARFRSPRFADVLLANDTRFGSETRAHCTTQPISLLRRNVTAACVPTPRKLSHQRA